MSRHHHHRHNPFSPDHESKVENEQRDTTMAEETKEQETIKTLPVKLPETVRNLRTKTGLKNPQRRSPLRQLLKTQPHPKAAKRQENRREGVTRGTDSPAESSS